MLQTDKKVVVGVAKRVSTGHEKRLKSTETRGVLLNTRPKVQVGASNSSRTALYEGAGARRLLTTGSASRNEDGG